MDTKTPPPSSKIKNSNEEEEEEDYIDMEVTSSSSCSSPQISREFEFQMASVSINDKDTITTTTTSPADELFYRGKLLPLHLPPRLEMVQKLLTTSKIESFQLGQKQQDDERFSISTNNFTNTRTPFNSCNISSSQMVQKVLQTSKIQSFQEEKEERFSISTKNLMNTRTPFDSCNISSSQMVQKLLQTSKIESFQEQQEERFSISTKNLISTNTSTPFESCNISPSESCRVSCELNPDEYFFEWSTEFSTFFKDNHPKMKSWSKKLKLVKQSLISQKLKASTSKAYLNLRSLFNKSACSDHQQEVSNGTKECSNKYIKVSKRTPFGHIGKCTHSPTLASVIRDNEGDQGVHHEDNVNSHRRSFSAAIKKHSPTKCLSSSSSSNGSSSSSSSSSSFSLNSNGFYELNILKRSSSATTEIEGSIEAAIAHCKKSQVLCNPKRKFIEAEGINSLSISKIAATEIQERSDLCRF
ncbi:probable membrane-associated kinase regulator 4 [Solanum dulcamara]|uniref:probable membrane-associated kinase regulator 4 n=1 Tax=Solanum dulcamara TaxID=45834 RepID=UPI002484DEC6|nr:probable membrane-associated kinase regulator 4 [Solanum dulcamara]